MNNRIKKLRKELDLTQQKFGERIGVKGNTIAQYESGRNEPIDAVIALICREFGVNEEWLRNGAGEMFAPDPGNELDALASKYSLSAADQILIEKYVSLKPSARETIMNFITDVVAALDVPDNTYGDIPDTPEELEAKYPAADRPDDQNRVG